MIRITGGQFLGKKLVCPPGLEVRPTMSSIRESLFSILGSRLAQARFLDLFAGCGIVGYEALSRGASFVEAVDINLRHCQVLEKNRLNLNIATDTYHIRCIDVWQWIMRFVSDDKLLPFDIVFLDPPYLFDLLDPLIDACFERQLVKPDGILICEHSVKVKPLVSKATRVETRQYGDSALSFYTYPSESTEIQS